MKTCLMVVMFITFMLYPYANYGNNVKDGQNNSLEVDADMIINSGDQVPSDRKASNVYSSDGRLLGTFGLQGNQRNQVNAAPYFLDFLRKRMMANKPRRTDYSNYAEYHADSLAWQDDPLYGWCNKNVKVNGSHYNIYNDGLTIYATIDSRMQKYAEEACYKRVAEELQPVFDKEIRGSLNAPYSKCVSFSEVSHYMRQAMRATQRYRLMKNMGHSEESIAKAFNTRRRMRIFTYRGEKDTVLTPMDSLRYMKAFLRTGFVSMNPMNGYVKAYVGGLNFAKFPYDMATKGKRQIGSAIQPFIYTLALSPYGGNMNPCTKVVNDEITYNDELGREFRPKNGNRAREGEMVPLKWGLQQSSNWVAAYLTNQLRPANLKKMLIRFGLQEPNIQATLPLCLGPCTASVVEMTSAYTAFANGGFRTTPIYVTKICDNNHNVLATFKPHIKEIMDRNTADQMLYMLEAVVNGGTATRLRFRYKLQAQMGGKTGNTNYNSDGWFIGVTPNLVTGCWVGGESSDIHFDSTKDGQGENTALPIFAYYMKSLYSDPTLVYSEHDGFNLPIGFDPCDNETNLDLDDEELEIIDEEDIIEIIEE